MKAPKLRFKADDGSEFPEWEEKRLGDVGTVAMCKRVFKEQTSENGEVPFFKIGTFGDKPDAYISYKLFDELKTKYPYPQKGTVLLSASGTVGRQVIYNGEDAYYQDSNIVWLEHDATIMDGFLKQFYSIVKWKGLEGSTIKRLYNKTILDTMFYLPSLPEQQKIADFLSTIDEIIQSTESELTAWQERKKGVMQKIFNREVRFKADDGSEFPEWEEKKMTQLFTRIVEKNRTDLSPLTIIQGQGTVRRDESDRRIAYDKKGLKNYKAVKKDDFIVHLRSFEGGLEIANQDGIVSPAYHVYRGSGNVCPQFYYPYFRSNNFIKGRLAICVTGVRDGKNIEMDTFDELLLPCPSLPEQKKIADCLSSLDDVINQINAELSAWKEFKKGLLQQMFV